MAYNQIESRGVRISLEELKRAEKDGLISLSGTFEETGFSNPKPHYKIYTPNLDQIMAIINGKEIHGVFEIWHGNPCGLLRIFSGNRNNYYSFDYSRDEIEGVHFQAYN